MKLLCTKSKRECHSFSDDYAKSGLEFHQIENIEAYGREYHAVRSKTTSHDCLSTLHHYLPHSGIHTHSLARRHYPHHPRTQWDLLEAEILDQG